MHSAAAEALQSLYRPAVIASEWFGRGVRIRRPRVWVLPVKNVQSKVSLYTPDIAPLL